MTTATTTTTATAKALTADQKAFQKRVRAILETEVDRLITRRDGSVEARRGYFYRNGGTAQGFANRVEKLLAAAGLEARVQGDDHWAAWPRESYFLATITQLPEDPAPVREWDEFSTSPEGMNLHPLA